MKKAVLLAVILIAGAWGVQKWKVWKPVADANALAARSSIATVEKRDITFSVNAAGEIGPAEQVSVRPEVNGKIENMPVDIGDVVRQGELLFKLDDRDLQIEKETQQTEIERAKLQVEQAQRNFKRSEMLYKDHLISQELFDDTKTEYELAANALERSQRSLDMVNDKLRRTRIVAPFDCTVLTRPVSAGQAVSGSGGFNSGTEVLTIADLHAMIINAHINQADVTRLKPNQEVEVQVEAVPGLQVTGMVQRIAPQATIKNNIKGFAVRILLKDVDKRVRPGMTANIKIPVASAENVVAIPLAAVFTETDPDTQQIQRYVYVKNGDRFEKRTVQIGVSDYFFAEVQQGLNPGEQVSLEPPKDEQTQLTQARVGGAPGLTDSSGKSSSRPKSFAPAAQKTAAKDKAAGH